MRSSIIFILLVCAFTVASGYIPAVGFLLYGEEVPGEALELFD